MKQLVRNIKKGKAPDMALREMLNKLKGRFTAIASFLNVESEYIANYENLCTQFAEFVKEKCEAHYEPGKPESLNDLLHDVTDMFPLVWNEFLQVTGERDIFNEM